MWTMKIGYSVNKVTVLKYLEIYGLHDPPAKLGLSGFIRKKYLDGKIISFESETLAAA